MPVPPRSNPNTRWRAGTLAQRPPAVYCRSGDAYYATDNNTRYEVNNGTWEQPAVAEPGSVATTNTSAGIPTIDHNTLPTILMLGLTEPLDGGGGYLIADPADVTSPADGGTVFLGLDSVRWKRFDALSTFRWNVKWFGAQGDGVTDDTAAFQACLNALAAKAYATPFGTEFGVGVCYVPSGVYALSDTLHLGDHCAIQGDSQASSFLVFSQDSSGTQKGDGIVVLDATENFSTQCVVSDLTIHNTNPNNTLGAAVDFIGGADNSVHRVSCSDWAIGICVDGSDQTLIEKCVIGGSLNNDPSLSTGIWLANGIRHNRGNTVPNATNGVEIRSCSFNGPGVNVWHDDGVGHTVEGCNSEGGIVGRISGASQVVHRRWNQEGQASAIALFHFDALGASTSQFVCDGFTVEDCFFQGSVSKPTVLIDYYAVFYNLRWGSVHVQGSMSIGAWQVAVGPHGETNGSCFTNIGGTVITWGEEPVGGPLFDVDPVNRQDLNISVSPPTYTVATIPVSSARWQAGRQAWVSDARKTINGVLEAPGMGTGVLAYHQGGGVWKDPATQAVVQA
jgi:Pectate lyase superfamily protein